MVRIADAVWQVTERAHDKAGLLSAYLSSVHGTVKKARLIRHPCCRLLRLTSVLVQVAEVAAGHGTGDLCVGVCVSVKCR